MSMFGGEFGVFTVNEFVSKPFKGFAFQKSSTYSDDF